MRLLGGFVRQLDGTLALTRRPGPRLLVEFPGNLP
jgi:hypothetical protein